MMKEGIGFAAIVLAALMTLGALCFGIERFANWERRNYENIERSRLCLDEATLLATAAGSPSQHQCPNVRHVMRVMVGSEATPNNYASLVACECDRTDGGR
jgi:hypothetical protein